MFEIDLVKVNALKILRGQLGPRVGRLSPALVEDLHEHFLDPTLQIPEHPLMEDMVKSFTDVQPIPGQRRGSPLEIATLVSRGVVSVNHDSLAEVLTGISFSPEAFVAAYDATTAAVRSLSDVASAYQDISEGADQMATSVLREISKRGLIGSPAMSSEEEEYLFMVNRSRAMSRLLMEDPTGKSVVSFARTELEKEIPNLDASRGKITHFALRGHDFAIGLYGISYDIAERRLKP